MHKSNATLAAVEIQPSIIDEIKVAQKEDEQLQAIMEKTKEVEEIEFLIKEDES